MCYEYNYFWAQHALRTPQNSQTVLKLLPPGHLYTPLSPSHTLHQVMAIVYYWSYSRNYYYYYVLVGTAVSVALTLHPLHLQKCLHQLCIPH